MSINTAVHRLAAFPLVLFAGLAAAATTGPDFITESSTDVGKPGKAGSVKREPGSLVISGGGQNMWFTNDSFHFAWVRKSGDFRLSAAIEWLTKTGDPHRKACLIVRQNLEPASAYIDVAFHGDGLTSLQWRETAGGLTREIQLSEKNPARVAIERQGTVFMAKVPSTGEESRLVPAGAFTRLEFTDPVYVGLAVCAHDDAALATARFSDVKLESIAGRGEKLLHSSLETISIGSQDRKVVHSTPAHFEAPNWTRDGSALIYNSSGRLFRLPVSGGTAQLIDTKFADKCNNDHGLSPDGSWLAISDQSATGKSLIYVLPAQGGEPRQVTALGPSYWHGWSPDGRTLAYCAERGGEYDIYTIGVDGGEETRLTSAKGLDDGPDYSPDGKYIYFNSNRTGSMHIWRMRPDGSAQEQVTSDEFNDWFPHPSPDGKWIAFLSYGPGVEGHPANHPVRLRLLPVTGGPVQELTRLFGGQGTLNVPSWAPDSKSLAFVSYELIYP